MKENIYTVKILDLVVDEDFEFLFIVMESMICDLRSLLTSARAIKFDEEHAQFLIFNLL